MSLGQKELGVHERVLREKKLKVTKVRVSLMQLLSHDHRLFSIDELVGELGSQKKSLQKTDWSTIYRSLIHFEKAGLVTKTDFGDGVSRYEWKSETEDHHHHHIVCTECKTILPLEDCSIKALEKKVKALGFSKVHHKLEFFGICTECTR